MAIARGVTDRLRTIFELFGMLKSNKRWWAIPAFFLLMLLGLALAGLHAIPYIAPFIYTVF